MFRRSESPELHERVTLACPRRGRPWARVVNHAHNRVEFHQIADTALMGEL